MLQFAAFELGLHCLHNTSKRTEGWIICNFSSFSTVFQSFQEDDRLIMKGCVQPTELPGLQKGYSVQKGLRIQVSAVGLPKMENVALLFDKCICIAYYYPTSVLSKTNWWSKRKFPESFSHVQEFCGTSTRFFATK